MPSRAAVSWKNGHLLEFNHIPTAKPLLMLENRWGAFRGRSYVLTEHLRGINAYDYFKNHSDVFAKEKLTKEIVEVVSRLHQCMFVHNDLKFQNILVVNDKPVLIDLDGMRKLGTSEAKGFISDWSRLNRGSCIKVNEFPDLKGFHHEEIDLSISVIIPAYNYASRITKAIESVMQQIGPNDELIVVNDGSTDDTGVVLAKLSQKYSNNIHVFGQRNKGAGAARNKGIKESKCEYVLFLDADDELLGDALETYRCAITNGEGANLFLAEHESVEEDGSLKGHGIGVIHSKSEKNVESYWKKSIAMSHGSFIAKKSLFNKICYSENLRSGEDIPVFTHLLAIGMVFPIRKTVVRVYKHEDSLRNKVFTESLSCLLDNIFDPNMLSPKLMHFKQRYLARRMLSLSRDYFIKGDCHEGRRVYFEAIKLSPLLALKWSYLKKFINSNFGS